MQRRLPGHRGHRHLPDRGAPERRSQHQQRSGSHQQQRRRKQPEELIIKRQTLSRQIHSFRLISKVELRISLKSGSRQGHIGLFHFLSPHICFEQSCCWRCGYVSTSLANSEHQLYQPVLVKFPQWKDKVMHPVQTSTF